MTRPRTPAAVTLRSDCGFTLVELAVTITIVGVLGGVLSIAAVLAFKTIDPATSSLAASNGGQELSRDLLSDVTGADDVWAGGTAADPGCAGGTAPPLLHTYRALDKTGVANPQVSDYVVTSTANGQTELARVACSGGSSATTLVVPALAGTPGVTGTVRSSTGLVLTSGPIGATTLAAPLSGTDQTLSLASATGFPTSGPYAITVEDEVMTVIGGFGSATLTVVRAPSTANHALGSPVVAQPRLLSLSLTYLDGSGYSASFTRRPS